MKQLEVLISDFVEVEYGIHALLVVLKTLEEIYDMEYQKELKANLTVIIRQLDSLSKDLKIDIEKLDEWMLENPRK